MRKVSIAAGLLTLGFLSGCATNVSPHSYSVEAVGQVNRTISANVISARPVDISGTTGTGAGVGMGAGAVAGSAIGGSGRANLLGAIGGAVVGGLAGAAIEQNATKQIGMEYVVQTENGNLMTLVQGPEASFQVGDRVLVLYGSPARIIADPRK
ncbi:hypothetical protein FXN63_11205 [Pigmentiphaga aceris]|uniref:Glycine zipper 2TM domain-containing protein n=1 Tax=Pigmentiphaga aceris TaxID=1940612 RepID=A0A5C0AX31_9BURK|nr:hypothetical protein [Pigmentiphaga aceris]QEI06336.1 hypothetical protein FXN63_11205 [Pigmentiphaga aceris]